MSSIVAVAGRLTVFEIAPEMNGWVADIMSMWPVCEIERSPTATSNTEQVLVLQAGRPDDRVVLVDVGLDLLDLGLASSRASRAPGPPSR